MHMQFLEEEILEIPETTWQSMVGLDIHPRALPASMGHDEGSFRGKVDLSGAWRGAVLLHGSRQLARAEAAVIFSHEPGGGPEQGFLDAMYELRSPICGNIKPLVSEPCSRLFPR
jgi:hypothetical protein